MPESSLHSKANKKSVLTHYQVPTSILIKRTDKPLSWAVRGHAPSPQQGVVSERVVCSEANTTPISDWDASFDQQIYNNVNKGPLEKCLQELLFVCLN